MLGALASCKVSCYVTDFPSEDLLGEKGVIALPHLGASTEESEENCAKMAAIEIKDYLEFGNITNSVNFPNCVLSYTGKKRIAIMHKNVPKKLSSILEYISMLGINVDNMINKSRRDLAYTIIDIDGTCPENLVEDISSLPDIMAARGI
jgi:D-3-phosphoglycerate dehydrogenase